MLAGPRGQATDALADFTDLFPTLLDLAGIARDPAAVGDGRSWVPLLRGRIMNRGLGFSRSVTMLFFRLHAATGDATYREVAKRALLWCLENQYAGPDPEAHGSLVGVTPESAVGYRPWFRVACTYSSGFSALAALEELKLQRSAGK